MMEISKSQLEEIYRHAKETYPQECCGIIVGTSNGKKVVKEVHRGRNLITERAKDRYELDPLDILRVQKGCRIKELEIIGFYHSHPEAASRPSKYDAERAWPDYSYLIISVVNGTIQGINSWIFNEQLRNFEEEQIAAAEQGSTR